MKILAALIISSLTLAGCAGPKVNSTDAMLIEQGRASAKASCVDSKRMADSAKYQAIAALPKEQVALVMAMEAMKEQAIALTGKKGDCDMGMGYFEYAADVAKSQNEALSKIAPAVVTGTVAGLGLWTTGDVMKTALKNSGNHNTTTVEGDGNSASYEHNQVTSNVENRTDMGDGNGTVNVTNPAVTGPDKSTSETINEAPAEVPVVPVEVVE